MRSNRAQRFSLQAQATDEHEDALEAEVAMTSEAPPLPSDPKIRAQILADIEQGLAEARAGHGVDVDTVMADWDA